MATDRNEQSFFEFFTSLQWTIPSRAPAWHKYVFPNEYGTLEASSQYLMDFRVQNHLSLRGRKTIGPHLRRMFEFNLLEGVSALSFFYDSVPQAAEDSLFNSFDHSTNQRPSLNRSFLVPMHTGIGRGRNRPVLNTETELETDQNERSQDSEFLVSELSPYDYIRPSGVQMAGTAYSDGALDAYFSTSIDETWRVNLNALSMLSSLAMSSMTFAVYRDSPNACVRTFYDTHDHLIGLSVLGNPLQTAPQWNLGAELVYSGTQRQPGLSIGTSYRLAPINGGRERLITCTISPISGHIVTAFTAVLGRYAVAATRLEYNMHSNESNVGFGLQVAPTAESPYGLTLGIENRTGAALVFTAILDAIMIEIGTGFKFHKRSPDAQFGISLSVDT
eukprot:Clim_evm126s149 gene=Clim_evmTU126s149